MARGRSTRGWQPLCDAPERLGRATSPPRSCPDGLALHRSTLDRRLRRLECMWTDDGPREPAFRRRSALGHKRQVRRASPAWSAHHVMAAIHQPEAARLRPGVPLKRSEPASLSSRGAIRGAQVGGLADPSRCSRRRYDDGPPSRHSRGGTGNALAAA